MVKKNISITLDEKVVEKIDKCRGLIPRSRYIASLIEKGGGDGLSLD